jgi:Eukaryotic aspartyl protease
LTKAHQYPGHTIYNPANSSTAHQVTGTWNISYGDGSSASGNVYTDTVTVGNIAIPNQAVELAEKLSSSFLQNGGNDGLLGLAWPSINTVTPNPVSS